MHATNGGSNVGGDFACNTCSEGELRPRETVCAPPIRHHDIACNTLPCSFTWKGLLTHDDRKSAIVTITRKRGRKQPVEPEADAEAEARVKAFLARMVRPGGPLPPDASE